MKPRAHLAPAIQQVITQQLADASGVDPRSLDASRLQWVIEARCRALQLNDPTEYPAKLQALPEELNELIEAIVVQETRFFRDPAVFEHLRRWLPQIAGEEPGEIRILSAPCSTGQEAYSLAATVQLAGVPLERVRIDAFDISDNALAVARFGQYSEEALKKLTLEQQLACGAFNGNNWKMHDALCSRINFERHNLAEPNAFVVDRGYHLILCRNLFIYLRPAARTALAQSLSQALVPGGRLILGSADRVEEVSELFAPLKPAASFAFTHRGAAVAVPVITRHVTRSKPQAPIPALRATVPPPPEATPEPSITTAEGLYRRAVEHEQHGELRRAERRCRQALYLDPKYLPALELLEKLWGQHPNIRLRRALEARILRHRVGAENIGPTGNPWMETA